NLFTAPVVNFGADGPGTVSNAFSLVLSSATVGTTLHATALDGTPLANMSLADRAISLVQVSATVVEGRVGTNTADPGDDYLVFLIFVANPGDPANVHLVVDQFAPIDHGDDGNTFDAQALLNLLGTGTLSVQLTTTVVDGDGDVATASAQVVVIDAQR